jgi:hypothetical protein
MEEADFVQGLISIIILKKIGILCGGVVSLAVGGFLYGGGQEQSQCLTTSGTSGACGLDLSSAQLLTNVGLFFLILGSILTIFGIVIIYKRRVSRAQEKKQRQN